MTFQSRCDVEIYENLERFSLSSHGDNREKPWAKYLLPEFPGYEVFWRRYVVPLTNRIDPQVSQSNNPNLWIRLRESVSSRHERMVMHHYSVFYYLARAMERIRMEQSAELPEDIFSLLDACGDNVNAFFNSIREILRDFD